MKNPTIYLLISGSKPYLDINGKIAINWTGVRLSSPPPIKSTYDESPRNSRAFCCAWEGLVEVASNN